MDATPVVAGSPMAGALRGMTQIKDLEPSI
jgi:hypothetical protein